MAAGGLIRRAVRAYGEQADREAEELRGLLKALAATHQETVRQLDRTEHKLDETLAYLAGAGTQKRPKAKPHP